MSNSENNNENINIIDQDVQLPGYLTAPQNAIGIVVFALASGDQRNSERLQKMAKKLNEEGFATLLFDLLTESEGKQSNKRYNIKLLSLRLEVALDWVKRHRLVRHLPLGILGFNAGAAAAMEACAHSPIETAALVSVSGRVDMVEKYLPYVECPCLLVVGSRDDLALKANKNMMEYLSYARLHVINGAGHGFENGDQKEELFNVSCRWFRRYFNRKSYTAHQEEYKTENMRLPFYDRYEASHFLARELMKYQKENPLVLAVPRGAVAMADVISTELDCDMDIVLVKKLGSPDNPEIAMGSINEFGDVYLSGNAAQQASEEEIAAIAQAQQSKLREYRQRFGSFNEPKDVQDRTVIIVDDGIATGSTMLSAVITVKEKGAKKVVVASPVVSKSAKKMLELAADETVFLDAPENFYAVAQFYENFPQVNDGDVERILR